VELRAECLTDRRRDGHEFLREIVDSVAQAVTQARSREERAHTLRGAVEAIGQDASDSIRGFLLGRGALELLRGLGWLTDKTYQA